MGHLTVVIGSMRRASWREDLFPDVPPLHGAHFASHRPAIRPAVGPFRGLVGSFRGGVLPPAPPPLLPPLLGLIGALHGAAAAGGGGAHGEVDVGVFVGGGRRGREICVYKYGANDGGMSSWDSLRAVKEDWFGVTSNGLPG